MRPGFGAAENIRYLVLSKGVFAMKKRVTLLVALCIWKVVAVQTPYGEVQKKISSGYGVTREKYEYEDLARIAREQGISLAEVRKSIAHK